ncbi:FAD-dependent oxidoreductase [Brevibacillus sp. NRS-1366]|uniref:FAD-dependent oxidoreductase n=1 Tax=Brevibacillus sp. NRS-1366 TaxID=3233899 RepID=UPI003D22A804
MKHLQSQYDVIVCGGGLAGLCAAVAAARHGARTALIHDRPVLGGNSSSEVRVTPHGAARFHAYARETGIISELMELDRAYNHEQFYNNGWTNSLWDMRLYDMVTQTANLDLYLNTTVVEVVMSSERTISSVVGRVANAETNITFTGGIFIDCTGDGIVAALAGNEWRMGTESRVEFGEPHAPDVASGETMGTTIHFRAKDMGKPVPFQPPEWAVVYDDPSFFYDHDRNLEDIRAGYWWIELSVPWDTIHDAEQIRHELTRHVFGIWDWIKNKDPNTREMASHYALDWIGQVPGKRESRRIMGHYLMTEHDPVDRTVFNDEVAFGGWYIDLHIAGGLLGPTSNPPSAADICGPYGIPLRILIAKDRDNLMMAGRNVSATHAALGTLRVMATTALMGQAAGTAAAVAWQEGLSVAEIPERAMEQVQQTLLREGCFLPNVENMDPGDIARNAIVKADSEALSFGSGMPDENVGAENSLLSTKAQWIAVRGELKSVSVYLSNITEYDQTVEAALLPVEHIWDYRANDERQPVCREKLIVPPLFTGWIEWKVHLQEPVLNEGRYVRLDLSSEDQGVRWHPAKVLAPGQPSAYEMREGKFRSRDDGLSYSFKVDPPQPIFPAFSTIRGAARPYRSVNMWRSNPSCSLPQRLELYWEKPVSVGSVVMTFPGHLLQDFNQYPAFFREPECPSDYRIEAWSPDGWQTILRVEGNFCRHVRHVLPQLIVTDRLSVVFEATNGAESVVVHEIRCYETI